MADNDRVLLVDKLGNPIMVAGNLGQVSLGSRLLMEDESRIPIGVNGGGRGVVSPAAFEDSLAAAFTPTTIFSNTGTIVPAGKIKAIWVVVSGATWTFTSGIPLMRVFVSRVPVVAAPAAGAASGLAPGSHYLGLGASSAVTVAFAMTAAGVTTFPVGNSWRLSPAQFSSGVGNASPLAASIAGIPTLSDWDQFIGVEFQFPSAPTGGGNFNVYLEHAGT